MTEPYHPVRADFALAKISEGQVPSEFCRADDPNLPTYASSIEIWAADDPAFAQRLIEAKKLGARAMIADCIRIASDRSLKVDERRLAISTRQYLASLWSSECNPKTIVEQTTTVRNLTPRDEYIEQCVLYLGMTREQAATAYASNTGATVQ